jgi:hypothetical protein
MTKNASSPLLQLSSPYLYTRSILVFETILGEVKLLLALNQVSSKLVFATAVVTASIAAAFSFYLIDIFLSLLLSPPPSLSSLTLLPLLLLLSSSAAVTVATSDSLSTLLSSATSASATAVVATSSAAAFSF